jgi:hypothetical protein
MKLMKQFFVVFILFYITNMYAQGRIEERSLMNLGIAITDNDMPKSMNYKNAKLACQKLGKQWRIPTFEEFDSALNEYGMTELENNTYWTTMSGSAYPSFMTNAWQALEPSNLYSVRCVRRLRPSEMGE